MPVPARFAGVLVTAVFVVSVAAGCKRRDDRPRPPPAISPPASTSPAGPADAFGGKAAPAVRVAELKAELAADPKSAAKWTELGNLHYDLRERHEAVNAYARALELQPDNVNVLADQGVMYRELGEREKALANLKRARELDPRHVPTAFNLGVVQAELGQKDEAIRSFEAVIALQPDGPAAASARQLIQSLKNPPAEAGAKAAAPKATR